VILLIEGRLNGVTFAIPNDEPPGEWLVRSVGLQEGQNDFEYWALSSWGDSSDRGTSSAKVDTVPPDVGLDISGVSGTNGWYVSDTTVTAVGADATSGVASKLLTIDNSDWQPSLTLKEGVYTVTVSVTDNAGHESHSSTPVAVDTTTPSISMSVAGTLGNYGWYKSNIQVTAISTDATSGIATFDVSADGGAYQAYTPIAFSDGHHTLRFKAVDVAGNLTETPLQEFYVDTIPPVVDLPGSWPLGRDVSYDARDAGSGLLALRIVIEDENEKYAKVAWNRDASGASYSSHLDWNGEFRDQTVAPPGTYLVWIKAADKAGHEHFELGRVIVPQPNVLFNLLPTEEPIVSADPPLPPAELSETGGEPLVTVSPALDTSPPLSPAFGGETTESTGTTEGSTQSVLLSSGTGPAAATSSPGILWGGAAAAAIAAATAYALEATRKRKEEEEAQAAAVRAEIARDKAERAEKHLTKEEKAEQARAHDEKVQERKEREEWADLSREEKAQLKWEQERDDAYAQVVYENWLAQQEIREQMAENLTDFKDRQEMRWDAEQEALQEAAQEQREQMAQDARNQAIADKMTKFEEQEEAKWVAAQATIQEREAEKSWLQRTWEETKDARDKAWDWVDQHQSEIALVVGVAVGVAAIALSGGLATPLVAAAWVAGAAVVAAGATAAGTVMLNNHYGREWHENLLKNVAISGVAAVAVTGGWFLIQGATSAAGALCASNPTACARVEPILTAVDTGEELWLQSKMAYQTWRGDSAGAADTALELQMEHMDGGMPGNAIAKELGAEVIENVAKYSDEAISLVALYGDDAAQIIMSYGDDGVVALQKYGEDAIGLIAQYKDEAIDFVKRAEKLGVDPTDVLDNPPLPGQTLEGWLLDIDDPQNPVNMSLKFNLPDEEIEQIRGESVQNPDSKLFSIGYGRDAKIPFDEMANRFGDEYEMSFLSMSDSKWAQYGDAKAYGDFWEVNSDAIEWGIDERKIFVLNVDYNLASDASNPSSTRRFTYAELKLVENPKNNYTIIQNGEYSFFVPDELLDTYENFLPPELLTQ
jgi:hypothetical protein